MTTATHDAFVEIVQNQGTSGPVRFARSAARWSPARLLITVAGVIALSGGGGWYAVTAGHESTDVAQVDAEVIAVPARAAGIVSGVYVKENQFVKEGDLLVGLDSDVAEARFAQADAALSAAISTAAAADADARVADENAKGKVGHGGTSFVSAHTYDEAHQTGDVDASVAQTRAWAKAARAQVETARAALSLASLGLFDTRIVAPHDGVVSKAAIAEGEAVAAGQTLVKLVTPGVWITANFREVQLSRLRAGQPADIHVDAFPSLKLDGEVESSSGGMDSGFLWPLPDDTSDTETKVLHRVPVRIRVTPPQDIVLRPGMNVRVSVNTRT